MTLHFLPGIELSDYTLKEEFLIKGKKPRLEYSFSLKEIYSNVPSLPALETYVKLITIFERIDRILSVSGNQNMLRKFPKATKNEEAHRLIDILFNPFIKDFSNKISVKKGFSIYDINNLPPYSFELASPKKINHTFQWVDTNVKINIEDYTLPLKIEELVVKDLVYSSLEIYSYLLKHNNYFLAKNINFNYSMFFQDRILELVLGKQIYDFNKTINNGKTSNEIALNFIRGFENLTFQQLFFYSVFVGIIWTSLEEKQKSFLDHKDNELSNIESEIAKYKKSWGINHSDKFIKDIVNTSEHKNIIVILDDNGESVIDMAIFQKLLTENQLIDIAFVLNETPISNNISLQVFLSLICDEYFANIRKFMAIGRIKIILENQPFRSFELKYLSSKFFTQLNHADLVYIKGVNFFETLQSINKERYYCFTVYGMTSSLLTGFDERTGILVNINEDQLGFTYNKSDEIKTLKNVIEQTQ